MNTFPVHLHTATGTVACGADTLPIITTGQAGWSTCAACLNPTLRDRARAVLRDSRAAVAAQIDRDERRHRVMLALDALYRDTPWWQLHTKHWIRQCLAQLNAA
jgi:hypothetical protein